MRKFIAPLLLLVLVVTVFHSWFLPGLLSTFDFSYYSPLMLNDLSINPYAWGWHAGIDGLAGFISPYSWIIPILNFPQAIFSRFGFDQVFIERVSYLYPLLLLLIISPVVLTKYFFPKNKFYLLSVIIFAFNTYALLLAGGEIFLALAYSLIPLILTLFAHMFDTLNRGVPKHKYSIIAGLLVSLQIMLDPRVTYVTIFIVMFYVIFSVLFQTGRFNKLEAKKYFYYFLFIFLIPGIITLLLQAFWIIPSIMYGRNPVEALGAGYSSAGAVKFFSFAKIEDAISLLHPNWPENIFGKVYFMRPEFLFLPILAYVSLLFVNKLKSQEEKVYILFFTLLGLIGAFLAKGANEPFGGFYLWLFNHVPGFIMFRDPSKWYPLVALSYSILIPFSIWKVYEWIKSQPKFQISNFKFQIKSKKQFFNGHNVFLILTILYLLFLIRPAILGQLGGLFKATSVPNDYIKLEKSLYEQPQYFRTLWVPMKQRFGFYSNNHPEMSAQILFNSTDYPKIINKLRTMEELIQESSVKYVIVPYDSQKEIFLKDRIYSDKVYEETITQLKRVKWLREISGFGKIRVFELGNYKSHFWSPSKNLRISFKYVNPVNYEIKVYGARRGDMLVFSEGYDKYWQVENMDFKINSTQFDTRFNSFKLIRGGNYSLTAYYTPQNWVNFGLLVSGTSLLAIIGFLVGLKIRQ